MFLNVRNDKRWLNKNVLYFHTLIKNAKIHFIIIIIIIIINSPSHQK